MRTSMRSLDIEALEWPVNFIVTCFIVQVLKKFSEIAIKYGVICYAIYGAQTQKHKK